MLLRTQVKVIGLLVLELRLDCDYLNREIRCQYRHNDSIAKTNKIIIVDLKTVFYLYIKNNYFIL